MSDYRAERDTAAPEQSSNWMVTECGGTGWEPVAQHMEEPMARLVADLLNDRRARLPRAAVDASRFRHALNVVVTSGVWGLGSGTPCQGCIQKIVASKDVLGE